MLAYRRNLDPVDNWANRHAGFCTDISGTLLLVRCSGIVTSASGILTDNLVGSGIHINAVGGDCPGKTELHADILKRSDIFVEYSPQTRIEGEIQQLPPDHPVTELWKVIASRAEGRRSGRQITLFDSVGFAIERFLGAALCQGTAWPHRTVRRAGSPRRSRRATRSVRHAAAGSDRSVSRVVRNRVQRSSFSIESIAEL